MSKEVEMTVDSNGYWGSEGPREFLFTLERSQVVKIGAKCSLCPEYFRIPEYFL